MSTRYVDNRIMNLREPRIRQFSPEAETRAVQVATGGEPAIDQRLEELEKEWDIESLLKLHAVTIALKYALFGSLVSRKYYMVPAIVGAIALQQATKGWSPPFALYRKIGRRPRRSIEEEKDALHYLKGD